MNKMVVLNHKNYLEFSLVKSYLLEINNLIRSDIDVVMCPSSLYIPFFRGKYNFLLGCQDVGLDVTGDVTAYACKSLDVKYALVGHCERKEKLSESNKVINEKIISCISNGISPIVFLGEDYYSYSMKKTGDVLIKQIKEYFSSVSVKEDIIICYEPTFSVNGDVILSNDEISEIVSFIKMIFIRNYGVNVRVLYGGGVNEESIKTLSKIDCLDGFVLGSVSVFPDRVLKVLNTI